ncbi:MAG: molecular chaperone DnaK, partial [Deltaproteobacteria bacterium]
YVGVGDGGQAVCVVPRGAPEGVEQTLDRDFSLVLGRPVRFRLFASAGFRPERAGDLVVDEELAELPPLQTVISGEGTAPVRLKAVLTEIGTLEVFCEGAQRWKLEFQLRGEARESGGVSQLPRNIDAAREQLQIVFGSDLWGVLWAGAQKRRRSPDHERMFLSLCGFLLRPGFGAPLDSWRVEQAWTLFSQGLTHHKESAAWAAWWVLWRRIAAGLPDEAHLALFEAIAPHLKPAPKQRVANPAKKAPGLGIDEMVRLLGALERLPVDRKIEAGAWLLERLSAGRAPGVAWALGRLGARIPVAGAAHYAVPPEVASEWLARLLALDFGAVEDAPFAIAQIARRSGDRARDLDEETRERAAARLERSAAPEDWALSIREARALGEKDEQRVFGEALPLGLHLAA